ncbi:VOC family protein [Afipia carboxidovorans]|uniref:VOC family protein n=1 Tax=Afipia carboxidovorans TaxID=40137 RepID=UPI0030886824|nr:VOC family protein [Afipia carboxidovorans]
MKINPYLFFGGTCQDAFKFYERALGARVNAMMPHEGSPAEEHAPPDWKKKILHASMSIGDQVIMGSDAPPEHFQKPQGFSVALNVEKPDEAERLFKNLSDGAQAVSMPMGETFFAHKFGMLVDKFGVPWMINCQKPM